MNKNSYLCNFIANNPDWKDKLSGRPYFLNMKQTGNFVIFNYNMVAEDIVYEEKDAIDENNTPITRWSRGLPLNPGDLYYERSNPFAPDGLIYAAGATLDKNGDIIGKAINCTRYTCDFSIPEVQEARGIIIDVSTLEVVCWPFRKFGNYGESYCDNIDWNSARTQEKIDGSIIKLWYNKAVSEWCVSTNAVIDAKEASICGGVTFYKLFKEAAEKNNLNYNTLDKEKTYIFELVGPLNRVVIKYDEVDIYHIGTRHNITGIESNDNIGIKKPKEFPLNSLDACVKAAEALCDGNNNGKFEIEHEGFVVVDKNWNRIKVKSPEYVMVHHALNGGILSKKKILTLILENDYEEYLTYFPQYKEIFETYLKKVEIEKARIEHAVNVANDIKVKMKDSSKKEIAEVIKTTLGKQSGWGFAVINANKTAEQIFSEMRMSNLLADFEKIEI